MFVLPELLKSGVYVDAKCWMVNSYQASETFHLKGYFGAFLQPDHSSLLDAHECTLSQQEAARVLTCVSHSCETLSIVDGSKVRNLSIVPWSVLAPLLKCTCSPFYLVYARQSTVMVSPSPNSCVTTPLAAHAMVLVPLVKSSSPPPPSLWLSWPPISSPFCQERAASAKIPLPSALAVAHPFVCLSH